MKAIALTGPKQLEIIDTPTPEPDGRHVIIKLAACGICGSDIHYWKMGVGMDGRPGLIMGHEFSGSVADAGSRDDLSAGDRVTALPVNPCGRCDNCVSGHSNICLNGIKRPNPGNNSPGAYAEYISVRPDMVRKLPDSVSDPAAALTEPASVALHAVKKAGIKTGDRILVTGGGPIGILCAAWAKISGASYVAIAEIDPFRIRFIADTKLADDVFDAADTGLKKTLKKASAGGFDAAIETSAADAGINTAVSALKPCGIMVLAGINFNPQPINTLALTIKEVSLFSAFAYLPFEFDIALDYIAKNTLSVESLVTRAIDLASVPGAFEDISSGRTKDIKIVITP